MQPVEFDPTFGKVAGSLADGRFKSYLRQVRSNSSPKKETDLVTGEL
jgi:hypothetical protein